MPRLVRLVIHQLIGRRAFTYRLSAYHNGQLLAHAKFDCVESLLRTMYSVLPRFGDILVANVPDGADTCATSCIIFAENIELDDPQLSGLGLHPDPQSGAVIGRRHFS